MRAEVDAGAGGDLFGLLPPWTLWAAAVVLYVVAALMLGGDPGSAVAYFLGFIADAVLRLATRPAGRRRRRRAVGGPTTMAAPD